MSTVHAQPMQRGFALLVTLALALSAAVPLVAPPRTRAVSNTVTISEVYGGGGNSGATLTHDFIELRNVTAQPISLDGWSVQYASSTGSAWQVTALSGSIPANGHYLIQEAQGAGGTTPLPTPDATGSIPMSGTSGKVALVSSTTALSGSCPTGASIVDFVGYGAANCFEGSGATGTLSNTTSASRIGDGTTDSDNNAADFTVGTPSPRNSGRSNPVVATCGGSLAVLQGAAGSRVIQATDADGVVTSIAITAITNDPGTISIGATTPATQAGGTASAEVTVGAATPAGDYTVSITATNATGDTGTCALDVSVQGVLTIGEVQGQTLDTEAGRTDASPLDGDTVFVRGVVTERIRLATSSGGTNYAFFLQDSLTAADGDPLTSDGIVVFIGSFTTVLRLGGGPAYFPEVGDQVVLRGVVDEFFNLTELTSPRFLAEEVDQGNLAEMVEIAEANPPDVLDDAYRYWERLEGMQVRVPAGAVVTGARDVFASTHDGEVWVVRGDHAVAQRTDPYARRVFRDVHPLDDAGGFGSFDNGNGMRILLVSHGLKWNASSNETLIAPARTFDTVTNELTGGVYFSFGKYGVEVTDQLVLAAGADPSNNAPPVAHDEATEYATAPYNVENLYDFRDDPFDGCDFTGNAGCPGVSPPFDYVPVSQADYQAHIDALADQILNDLHAPDVLLIQEAEDQDICAVVAGALDCDDGVDDRDGKPDTLQELGLAIAAKGGPLYDAAYDRDGADDRGIVSAFLYRTDRVELVEPAASHPVLGSAPAISYDGEPLAYNADVQNPKALNAELPAGTPGPIDGCDVDGVDCVFTRDPQVALFRVWRAGIGTSAFTELYAISNHFSSTPDNRVGQRTQQAAYNAAIVEALLATDPDARVVVGGDFNVFPEPDDPFAPPNESNQLAALYELGLNDLWAVVLDAAPASAYSYVFEGQAQTLDNQFTTDALFADLNGVRYAHVNADWPAAHGADGSRGASDHDPQVARFDAVTVDAFLDFVGYLVGVGQLDAGTADAIRDRLLGALATESTAARDRQLDQLEAFIERHARSHIHRDAATSLVRELELLRDALE